jgi:hypothetical protein
MISRRGEVAARFNDISAAGHATGRRANEEKRKREEEKADTNVFQFTSHA